MTSRRIARLGLRHFAKRKQRARQLLLRQLPEKIRLVFLLISATQKFVATTSAVALHSRVMARRNFLATKAQRQPIERCKLQSSVARDTRDGCLTTQVTRDKRLDNISFEVAF